MMELSQYQTTSPCDTVAGQQSRANQVAGLPACLCCLSRTDSRKQAPQMLSWVAVWTVGSPVGRLHIATLYWSCVITPWWQQQCALLVRLRGSSFQTVRASDCQWLHEMCNCILMWYNYAVAFSGDNNDGEGARYKRRCVASKLFTQQQINDEHWPSLTCWLCLLFLPSKLH